MFSTCKAKEADPNGRSVKYSAVSQRKPYDSAQVQKTRDFRFPGAQWCPKRGPGGLGKIYVVVGRNDCYRRDVYHRFAIIESINYESRKSLLDFFWSSFKKIRTAHNTFITSLENPLRDHQKNNKKGCMQ